MSVSATKVSNVVLQWLLVLGVDDRGAGGMGGHDFVSAQFENFTFCEVSKAPGVEEVGFPRGGRSRLGLRSTMTADDIESTIRI